MQSRTLVCFALALVVAGCAGPTGGKGSSSTSARPAVYETPCIADGHGFVPGLAATATRSIPTGFIRTMQPLQVSGGNNSAMLDARLGKGRYVLDDLEWHVPIHPEFEPEMHAGGRPDRRGNVSLIAQLPAMFGNATSRELLVQFVQNVTGLGRPASETLGDRWMQDAYHFKLDAHERPDALDLPEMVRHHIELPAATASWGPFLDRLGKEGEWREALHGAGYHQMQQGAWEARYYVQTWQLQGDVRGNHVDLRADFGDADYVTVNMARGNDWQSRADATLNEFLAAWGLPHPSRHEFYSGTGCV